jgi:glycosyltransferase involved in cell wall biosynthesis
MIYYSIPWDSSMNIGRYYNQFMSSLPDDGVACFIDGDATFTTVNFGKQLEAVLEANPQCGLFVGLTNRVGCTWQIADGVDIESNDLAYHREVGARLSQEHWATCVPVPNDPTKLLSGVLILLRKSLWSKVGGFPEQGMLGVDNELHRRVTKLGEPILLMKGVYVYHWYRGGNKDEKSHLKRTRKAVYTAITGKYDVLRDPSVVTAGWDYVCFTDDPSLKSDIWTIAPIQVGSFDVVKAARRRKILSNEYLIGRDLTVWVDGKLKIECNMDEFVARFHGPGPITMLTHPDRDCIYDEAEACKRLRKDDPRTVDSHMSRIRLAGMPKKSGMVDTCIIIRTQTPTIKKLEQEWWRMVESGSRRDQLSFNFVSWRSRTSYKSVPYNDVVGPLFTKFKHEKEPPPVTEPVRKPVNVPEPSHEMVRSAAAVAAMAKDAPITYEAVQKHVRAKHRAATNVDRVVWAHSDFNYGNSLSHVSRETVRWLVMNGVPAKAWSWSSKLQDSPDIPVADRRALKTAAVIVMDRIRMPQPVWDSLKAEVPFIAAYYMCEGTKIKDTDVARLERYDAVFTPTQFCYRALVESGLKTPVHVWGHGMDPEVFPYAEPKPNRPFTYLWYGDENRRKGYDLFLKAFCELKVPNVRAWVRGPGTGFLSRLTDSYRHRKDIVFDTRVTPPVQLKELMSEVDVVVGPHRGEGFGLCTMEAMACGRPAIMTRWSGPLDYGGGDDITYWVDTDGYEPAQFDVGVQARPDFKKLVQLMSKAALEPEEVRRRGILASKHIHENWRWGQKVMDVLPVLRQLIPGCKL